MSSVSKKQSNYLMAGLFGLLLGCAGVTLWLYSRYTQAADAVEAVFTRGLQMDKNGRTIVPAVQEQALADARLRSFLIVGILTGICAILLVALVAWRRRQRILETKSTQMEEASV
ncbi:hypothetical protein EYC59_01435 [Candidatus Saccharibacteria bacterium]|nr:MAG: hypothetical protein EYC59_01435 [Candidatus Saccharibacteria bacterium]